ncbi:MAG: UvrD-helicase domain-containing protein, partial [Paracoccaceae bacterium]
MTLNSASIAQNRAADPAHSTWLSANAGSGKTRVLTDRVARLLLAGTAPQKILCLTYTKAAASEMQNRLFARLGEWAMLEDRPLFDALAALGIEGPIDEDTLRRARRLFARAIETPGGLKIQTIHSFCAAILRRFPIEAGVSPNFTELDEHGEALLHREIVDQMAAGVDVAAVDGLARNGSGEPLANILAQIAKNRDCFESDISWQDCLAQFGLPPDMTRERLLAEVFDGSEADLMTTLVARLLASGTNDAKAGAKLADLSFSPASLETLKGLEDIFLFGEKAEKAFAAKVGSFPTKALRESEPSMPALEALMLRVEAARTPRLALAEAEKTYALHHFAHRFLDLYIARKVASGLLDFEDLISRAGRLLSAREMADWVLFRLDGGIDQILVDEAQDTSPAQWRVIEALAAEFTAGHGARGTERRIFVVGDAKQSIYSF